MKQTILFCAICIMWQHVHAQKDCNLPNPGNLPLTDLGTSTYRGYTGGLYTGGSNKPTGNYLSDAIQQAKAIVPLDTAGNYKQNGIILMAGVGASNPRTEFEAFSAIADTFTAINPGVKFINTCIGGQGVQKMNDPSDNYWKQTQHMLDSLHFTARQVQIVWIETENTAAKDTAFPSAPRQLVIDLEKLLVTLKQKFPNLKLCYFSARAFSGWAPPNGSGVGYGLLAPRDYYNGWAIKWLVDSARLMQPGYRYKGSQQEIPMPLFASYHWTNGKQIRSDGFSLDCSTDVGADGLHLSAAGEQKIGQLIFNFFRTDTTAKYWFLDGKTAHSTRIDLSSLRVFPVPAGSELHLEIAGTKPAGCDFNISDITGRRLISGKVDAEHQVIDIHALAPGKYIINLYNKEEIHAAQFMKLP